MDIAERAGLRYVWPVPGKRPLNILQTIGNGCAFLDFNNDGNLDVLLVGDRVVLYQGDGKGHFKDVSAAVGLNSLHGHFLGCAVGDVDGDGYDDIYLSGYHTGVLLHNLQGKAFRDITRRSGLKPQPWGTSCGFAETIPGSGRLDLYVANYVQFGPQTSPQMCTNHDLKTACGPRFYSALKGVFYRGDGRGHFQDATAAAGFGAAWGRGLGVAFGAFDDSALPGLAVENDETPGDLFQPRRTNGTVHYSDIGDISGTAYDQDGNVHGGMGADWGDYDNDGRLDLFVGTFHNEAKCLYHNDGSAMFTNVSAQCGINRILMPYVSFGCKFFDFDNDGWLDLAVSDGHVQDNIHEIDPTTTYRQPTFLFHNDGRSPVSFTDVSKTAGSAFARPLEGRGLVTGDFDNDGRVDLLVVDSEGKPLLLHNETTVVGHWLGVKLLGIRSNRDGYGAVLRATMGHQTLLRQCQAGGSYLSSSDPRVHFGLGQARQVDTLTIRWPSGQTDTYHNLRADHYIAVREGTSPAALR